MSEYLDIGAARKRKGSGHQEKIMRVRKTCDAKDCDYADGGSTPGDTDSSHGRCVLSEGARIDITDPIGAILYLISSSGHRTCLRRAGRPTKQSA